MKYSEEIANEKHEANMLHCQWCQHRLAKGSDRLIKNVEKKFAPLAGKMIRCDKCGCESFVFSCALNEHDLHRYETFLPLAETIKRFEYKYRNEDPRWVKMIISRIKRGYTLMEQWSKSEDN